MVFLEGSIYIKYHSRPSSSTLSPPMDRNRLNLLMQSDNSEHYANILKLKEFFPSQNTMPY